MRFPNPQGVPSEATIEQLSNHHILNLLSPYGTWFFVPTRREERSLAYDASLQDYKALILQYKRLRPGRLGVSVHGRQLRDLQTNFQPSSTPYVFYAFSSLPTYQSLSDQFATGNGHSFGAWMHFVDVHAVPAGATAIVPLCGSQVGVRLRGHRSLQPIPSFCLFSLVQRFAACEIGIPAAVVSERPPSEVVADGRIAQPHLHILWAKP